MSGRVQILNAMGLPFEDGNAREDDYVLVHSPIRGTRRKLASHFEPEPYSWDGYGDVHWDSYNGFSSTLTSADTQHAAINIDITSDMVPCLVRVVFRAAVYLEVPASSNAYALIDLRRNGTEIDAVPLAGLNLALGPVQVAVGVRSSTALMDMFAATSATTVQMRVYAQHVNGSGGDVAAKRWHVLVMPQGSLNGNLIDPL